MSLLGGHQTVAPGKFYTREFMLNYHFAPPAPRDASYLSVLLYPVLTFLYPIFDMVLVSILRRAAGRPISVGGRDHSSHRLVSLGLSEQRVVWLLWVVTVIGGAAGLVLDRVFGKERAV